MQCAGNVHNLISSKLHQLRMHPEAPVIWCVAAVQQQKDVYNAHDQYLCTP
jgi:hypothetical protein